MIGYPPPLPKKMHTNNEIKLSQKFLFNVHPLLNLVVQSLKKKKMINKCNNNMINGIYGLMNYRKIRIQKNTKKCIGICWVARYVISSLCPTPSWLYNITTFFLGMATPTSNTLGVETNTVVWWIAFLTMSGE